MIRAVISPIDLLGVSRQDAYDKAMQLLMPKLDDPDVRITVEYSEKSEAPCISFRYNGPQKDITKDGDELSLSVLKSVVSSHEYSFDQSEMPGNKLVYNIIS
ncbi:MAG: hypothetical protein K5668_06195 [Lachnospiraceae bacterium]|nr:hypothetical protein [Lachnospiraceae bacterium]